MPLSAFKEYDSKLYTEVMRRVCNILDNSPAIDAAPVVHARWIHRPDERICSNCGLRYSYFGGKDRNYCHQCGAKMDLESEGGNK